MPSKTIKNFVFDDSKILGKGSTGTVYLGKDLNTGSPIAVKVIELRTITNEITQFLLKNEMKALRTTNHPNVLKAIDIIKEPDNVYIVTEYLPKGTLANYIIRKGKIPEEEALEIFKQIVDGYEHILSLNIQHRDLKPQNILFDSRFKPVLSDFGYCENKGYLPKPSLQYNVGSPGFMAPESIVGNRYSESSEVWSLGAILYEMMSGRNYTNGRPVMEAIMMIRKEGPYYPSNASPFTKMLIKECMMLKPEKRMKVKELKQFLQQFIRRKRRAELAQQSTLSFDQQEEKLIRQALFAAKNSHQLNPLTEVNNAQQHPGFGQIAHQGQSLLHQAKSKFTEHGSNRSAQNPQAYLNVVSNSKSGSIQNSLIKGTSENYFQIEQSNGVQQGSAGIMATQAGNPASAASPYRTSDFVSNAPVSQVTSVLSANPIVSPMPVLTPMNPVATFGETNAPESETVKLQKLIEKQYQLLEQHTLQQQALQQQLLKQSKSIQQHAEQLKLNQAQSIRPNHQQAQSQQVEQQTVVSQAVHNVSADGIQSPQPLVQRTMDAKMGYQALIQQSSSFGSNQFLSQNSVLPQQLSLQQQQQQLLLQQQQQLIMQQQQQLALYQSRNPPKTERYSQLYTETNEQKLQPYQQYYQQMYQKAYRHFYQQMYQSLYQQQAQQPLQQYAHKYSQQYAQLQARQYVEKQHQALTAQMMESYKLW